MQIVWQIAVNVTSQKTVLPASGIFEEVKCLQRKPGTGAAHKAQVISGKFLEHLDNLDTGGTNPDLIVIVFLQEVDAPMIYDPLTPMPGPSWSTLLQFSNKRRLLAGDDTMHMLF